MDCRGSYADCNGPENSSGGAQYGHRRRDSLDKGSSCSTGVTETDVVWSKVAADARMPQSTIKRACTPRGRFRAIIRPVEQGPLNHPFYATHSILASPTQMPAASKQGLNRQQRKTDQQYDSFTVEEGQDASKTQYSRWKRSIAVPAASLHTAHSPQSPAPEVQKQWLQSQYVDSSSFVPNAPTESSHGQPFSERNQEGAIVQALKRRVWQLDPQTRAAFKDSLYRISRNTNVRVTHMGQPLQPSSVDYVVANLMYNSVALGNHCTVDVGRALPSKLLH